jgi:hypothetical protein
MAVGCIEKLNGEGLIVLNLIPHVRIGNHEHSTERQLLTYKV